MRDSDTAKVVVIGFPASRVCGCGPGDGTVTPLDQVTGDLAAADSSGHKGERCQDMFDLAVAVSPPTRCFRAISTVTGPASGWARLAQ